MIAHLPMYDTPENRAAHGRLWSAFREFHPDAPASFSNDSDVWADWLSPDLLISQTCGLPFRAKLNGKVNLIGTPDNHIEGCPAGHYRSAIIARKGSGLDLARNDYTFAFNEPLSQSGWGAAHAAGITGNRQVQSSGHALSAGMVLDGKADVAAIDALTWHFLQRDWDKANQLEVLTWTKPTPTLPYITALARDPKPLAQAMIRAIAAIDQNDRDQLCLHGLVQIPEAAYMLLPIPPAPQT